jgi:glycosyltransferase involved in cell wall biosynthesis
MQVTYSLIAGGSEMFAFKLAAGLERGRFRSVMCAVDKGGALEPEIEKLCIPYHILHRRYGFDPRLFWKLGRLCRKEKVDVLHSHHFNQLLYAAPAAKLLGLRLIHTEHSVKLFEKPRLRRALRVLARCCHKILAVGTDVATVLHEQVGIPETQIQIIRAGVDPALYQQDRATARHQLGLNPQNRVAAIVARLSPEKNHTNLLTAFAQVVQRLPDAKLLIVGDGADEAAVRALVEKLGLSQRVQMLGVRRDIPRILAATDVFVLSSDREGLPIAVLEALAAGCPVVCTTVGDLPLVVKDGATGRLVPPQDPPALAAALTELLADPDRAAAMGAAGREFVSREYSQQRMIEQHARIYAE